MRVILRTWRSQSQPLELTPALVIVSDPKADFSRKRRGSIGDESGAQRVQLACFWCRSKRVRCSGTKPVCEVGLFILTISDLMRYQACKKSSVTCEWPSGRRKKRTRKEMEEARRLEAQYIPRPSDQVSSEVSLDLVSPRGTDLYSHIRQRCPIIN